MRSLLTLTLVGMALGAAPSASAQPLSGPDLVREMSGNTLIGFNGSLWFSEYHAPDGQVLGYNGGVPNVDSCWQVRGDAVCYYYPRDRQDERSGTMEFCWNFERAGAKGYRIRPVGGGEGGVARLEAGNSAEHTTNGRNWTCDRMISRLAPRSTPARIALSPRRPDAHPKPTE